MAAINLDVCDETGENHAVLDRAGLEAALARPFAGFGTVELFPSIYEKGAALLHGLASRQVFENGNKRTAWLATMAYLDANGVTLGRVNTIQADMFVRAAGLDHSLEISDIAEWIEDAAFTAAQGVFDTRVEHMLLAGQQETDYPTGGLVTVLGAHLAGLTSLRFPEPADFALVTRIHRRPGDLGRRMAISVEIEQDERRRVMRQRFPRSWVRDLDPPFVGGHLEQPAGIMPIIVAMTLPCTILRPGTVWIVMQIDGVEAARKVMRITEGPAEIPFGVPDWLATTGDLGGRPPT